MSARIAILGFGTVGSAVARRLTSFDTSSGQSRLELTHIFDRRAVQKRTALRPDTSICWTTDIRDILKSDADIVIELLGGVDPAAEWIRDALMAGKSVVTANKQVVAHQGEALWRLAARQGRQLRFEAAVGGAMPIVRAIGDGLSGDRIVRIRAILNGTTNSVLSRIEATRCSIDAALADARANGFAEADPTSDLDGADASAKLAILCRLAFGLRVEPQHVARRTASAIGAADFDRALCCKATIRQLAHAEYDRRTSTLTAWVAPVAVPLASVFGRTRGPQNAALITCEHSGDIGIFGAGAGGDATASAVISDAVAIARDRAAIVPPPILTSDFKVHSMPTADCRLATDDWRLLEEAV